MPPWAKFARPAIVVEGSSAHFETPRGPIDFTFEPILNGKDAAAADFHLRCTDPRISGAEKVGGPCTGRIRVVWCDEDISWLARLIPVPASNPIHFECTDRSIQADKGVLKLYDRLNAHASDEADVECAHLDPGYDLKPGAG